VFLMNNVHDDEPVVFQTRWTLSYLRGPLTREQIQLLMRDRRAAAPESAPSAAAPALAASEASGGERPVLPPGITELFLPAEHGGAKDGPLIYRPALLGTARMHFADAKAAIDMWEQLAVWARTDGESADAVWQDAKITTDDESALDLEKEPVAGAAFAPLLAEFAKPKNYAAWATALKDHLYRNHTLSLWKCAALKQISRPGESKADFAVRLAHAAREDRDAQAEKLQGKYAPKLAALKEQIRRANQKVEREKSQSTQQTVQAAISFGASVLGALMGRKLASTANMNRAASAARAASRVAREQGDVHHAEETVEALQQRLDDLEAEFKAETDQLDAAAKPDALEMEAWEIRARKAEIAVDRAALVWKLNSVCETRTSPSRRS
jgi:hypothetical protein